MHHGIDPPSGAAADVLDDDPLWAQLSDDTSELIPQARAAASKARAWARRADVLARKPPANEVDGGEIVGADVADVDEPVGVGPQGGEEFAAGGVALDLPDGVPEACPFEAELKPADAGEQRSDPEVSTLHAPGTFRLAYAVGAPLAEPVELPLEAFACASVPFVEGDSTELAACHLPEQVGAVGEPRQSREVHQFGEVVAELARRSGLIGGELRLPVVAVPLAAGASEASEHLGEFDLEAVAIGPGAVEPRHQLVELDGSPFDPLGGCQLPPAGKHRDAVVTQARPVTPRVGLATARAGLHLVRHLLRARTLRHDAATPPIAADRDHLTRCELNAHEAPTV